MDDLLHFGQLFKVCANNYLAQIAHIFRQNAIIFLIILFLDNFLGICQLFTGHTDGQLLLFYLLTEILFPLLGIEVVACSAILSLNHHISDWWQRKISPNNMQETLLKLRKFAKGVQIFAKNKMKAQKIGFKYLFTVHIFNKSEFLKPVKHKWRLFRITSVIKYAVIVFLWPELFFTLGHTWVALLPTRQKTQTGIKGENLFF